MTAMLQILPNGNVWIPKLMGHIVDITNSSAQPVHIDKNLIEGPNANKRGKIFIPVILLLQVRSLEIHLVLLVVSMLDFTECFVLCLSPVLFYHEAYTKTHQGGC
jgi:hypothetical protein